MRRSRVRRSGAPHDLRPGRPGASRARRLRGGGATGHTRSRGQDPGGGSGERTAGGRGDRPRQELAARHGRPVPAHRVRLAARRPLARAQRAARLERPATWAATCARPSASTASPTPAGCWPTPARSCPTTTAAGFHSPGTGFEGEPLDGSFDYVVAIDYNRKPGTSPLDWTRPLGADRGGGIWLHVDHGGPTHGCVSIAEEHMKELLRTLDPALHPVVVMGDHASLAR